MRNPEAAMTDASDPVRLCLCGDVMVGPGIDQVLPRACGPVLHAPWVEDARAYRRIAEAVNGDIPAPVGSDSPWGDARARLARFTPDRRVINRETAVTASDAWWSGKHVHDRMHPDTAGVVTTAGIDACPLANNPVPDGGRAGLTGTLQGCRVAGAGEHPAAARSPAVPDPGDTGRLILLSLGSGSAVVPRDRAGRDRRPGVWRIDEGDPHSVDTVAC